MLHVSNGTNDGIDKSDQWAFQGDKQLDSADGISGIASVVCDLSKYKWRSTVPGTDKKVSDNIGDYFNEAACESSLFFAGKGFAEPISIYELHLGSFKRKGSGQTDYLQYHEHAEELIEYLHKMKFTHVERMPVATHPFYGSWGYQVTNYFSPTSRYGSPAELMALIDALHEAGIKVILDWVR